MNEPGRICPLSYRYGARAIARAALRRAQTLYVIGGLYGNLPALDTIGRMARAEPVVPTLCFNGDFNWFDIADSDFCEINQHVLANDAILGNVEAELVTPADDPDCGCAYPDSVDAGIVERSNQIHARLKSTARRHKALLDRIAQLPMFARYQVADCRIGVVHGDADSLAGWRFDVRALGDQQALPWLRSVFIASDVDLFASTHTCLPAMRRFMVAHGRAGWVLNNGAAGMPNFAGDSAGLCTRISASPSPHPVLNEVRVAGAYVALLPVRFDADLWRERFLAQWPAGSAAWLSYFERITRGPAFAPGQALALAG
ncbi:MAG: hypothetical protein EPN79_09500 [Burkholderiaceae bacterium]|nr:MAG: hypothetical protein EPN79_09500 [Burkholderiaceae bacterium]TBR76939.1 MAG: hypothetical protein EPN64_04895 [Burkholderiaceae bacterium]